MSMFARVIRYNTTYWYLLVVAILASSLVAMTDGIIGYSIGTVLTTISSKSGVTGSVLSGTSTSFLSGLVKKFVSEQSLTMANILPIAVILLYTMRGAAKFAQQYCTGMAGQYCVQDIRNEIYRKNMYLSLRYFNNNPTGVLMARILNDVGLMQSGLSEVIMSIFRDGLAVIFLLCVVFYRNWQLAIITIIVVPLMLFPTKTIARHLKRLARLGMERIGDLASILQETFSGIKVIKAFRLEEREIERFRISNLEYLVFLRKSQKYDALHNPIMDFISAIGTAGVIWFGLRYVTTAHMSPSDFFSFVISMGMLYTPIKKLLNAYSVVKRSLAAAERVFEVIDEKREICDPENPVPLDRARGEVEINGVSFAYNEENVLKDVSLSARKGEVIALVGPSGGGKTTLVSLIPRFYDVCSGQILIDGIDIRSLKIDDLTRQIALVDQETILFNETIINNIKYGKTDATDQEVITAAKAAYAHDFIVQMPDGYQTNIGDRGVRLSGGQKQRLCIARAILKNAPILILDEATSALDTESEQMVQQAINNLMSNRTTFVIAHRLSTIHHADKIVVIDKGEVVEMGNHQQLLENGGMYKKLHDMQFQNV